MKVLMTTDSIGGVWTYTLHLVSALRRHGVQTALASMGARLSGEQRREAREAGATALYATDLALEWMRDRGSEVDAAGEWLLDVRGQAPGLEWQRYRNDVERGLRAADVVVAPTAAMLQALGRHYSFTGERIVIHNGVAEVRAREKHPCVAAAGRAWDEAKNIAALERVAPRLPWQTRIVGAGTSEGVLSRATLHELLGHASIYAAPARYEPFGLGALEAATAGCALVLGDIDSLREVWGDAAAFADPEDDVALESALRTLIENPEELRALARRALERSRTYTPERMASAYAGVYVRAAARAVERVA